MTTFYPVDNEKKAMKSGWLKKQGGLVKSWNKKWFVLRNNHLYCYSTDDETKSEQDKIFIVGCKIVELPLSAGDTDKYLFEIRGMWLLFKRLLRYTFSQRQNVLK